MPPKQPLEPRPSGDPGRPGAARADAGKVEPRASTLPELTADEIRRYARHLVLPDFGEEGQRRLKAARVLCVGAGGLGSPLALYLAAAGVGTLGLVDDDVVDLTNLQRQILHGTSGVGRSKLESARARLRDVNPHVEVVEHHARLTSDNALEILDGYDVVVDGTDNFPTRYLVNDACVLTGTPNVYGSVFRWEGQVSLFAAPAGWRRRYEDGAEAGSDAGDPGDGTPGPCYRCLFREPPAPELVQNCAEGGVLGVLPGIVGSMQALETIKWILADGEPLAGRLLIFDGMSMRWREVAVRRNPDCPVCGDDPSQTELIDYELFCGLAPEGPQEGEGDAGSGSGSGESPGGIREYGARELEARLSGDHPPLLVDVREPWEWRLGNLEARGARLVPLGDVPERADELPRDREIVLYCRTGARSADAARTLAGLGFPRVVNLRGGLVAWKAQVDGEVEVA